MDSPGFCAHYCTYTTMEDSTKKIVSIVNKDKRETGGNSVAMEKISFIETIDNIFEEMGNVKEFCTDANKQISALFSSLQSWSPSTTTYLCMRLNGSASPRLFTKLTGLQQPHQQGATNKRRFHGIRFHWGTLHTAGCTTKERRCGVCTQ